jgi:hypothetical protein
MVDISADFVLSACQACANQGVCLSSLEWLVLAKDIVLYPPKWTSEVILSVAYCLGHGTVLTIFLSILASGLGFYWWIAVLGILAVLGIDIAAIRTVCKQPVYTISELALTLQVQGGGGYVPDGTTDLLDLLMMLLFLPVSIAASLDHKVTTIPWEQMENVMLSKTLWFKTLYIQAQGQSFGKKTMLCYHLDYAVAYSEPFLDALKQLAPEDNPLRQFLCK